ncbi:putative iron-regulated membrane protein; Iron-uptake factor PiuB [Collimonas arenae]|uniref:Putative iron-regulated membrane protein Iron-uptake factor PiuB n=1 Tax=Collimonas arenae TaxID=279058 RepID=A0A0A1FCG4_9BURK|nr:putative iron-regulated membrane protein; Iron-uptake factor PiuB [Collimonas arenae]
MRQVPLFPVGHSRESIPCRKIARCFIDAADLIGKGDGGDRQRTLHIDQYSGAVIKDLRFTDYNPASKLVTLGVALHMGEYFGLANQLICAAISLTLLGMAVTGFVMWWKRRPHNSVGAPKRVLQPPPSIKRWKALYGSPWHPVPLDGRHHGCGMAGRHLVFQEPGLSFVRKPLLSRPSLLSSHR